MQFIKKHWKGDYPLWRSFWINFILVDVILIVGFALFLSYYLSDKEMFIRLLFNYSIIAVFIAIWQTVGIYRSAEKYKTEKKYLPFLAQLFSISCLIRTIMSLSSLLFSPEETMLTLNEQIDTMLKTQQEIIQQQENSQETNNVSKTETKE